MTWLGVTGPSSGGWFSLSGTPAPGGFDAAPVSLLPRGSLIIEAHNAGGPRPQVLLAFERSHPWSGSLSLQALPDGSIILVEAQQDDTTSVVLTCPYTDRSDILRLTYSWDAPHRSGRLTVERPEPGSTHSVDLAGAHPMLASDLRDIMTRPRRRRMDRGVIFAAISDRVEPVGPMPGLTGETPILTDSGERPLRALRRGDVIVTDRGARVPVLQHVRRTVPARGSFRPIRLRARYFGLTRDIVVAPYQQLVMRGSDVEYMFGREAVLAPARHLLNNVSAVPAHGPEMVTFHQLLLPGHETLVAAGCAVESLFVGRLRRKPDRLAASILAPFERSLLPEHAQPVWPVLRPFEAVTLATERAA